MKCIKCGKELVTDDYGYYCCNVNCENYDITFLAEEPKSSFDLLTHKEYEKVLKLVEVGGESWEIATEQIIDERY